MTHVTCRLTAKNRDQLLNRTLDNRVWPAITHTHTHPCNGPFSRTTRVSRYQKGKTNLDFTEARDSGSDSGISWAVVYASLHLAPDR